MTEPYTPATENVRLGYAYRPNLPEGQRHHQPLLEEFDRWLEAHDREVRAAALAEYPFAIENRVVKEPIVALVRDRETASIFVEDWLDMRVRPASELL